MIGTVRSFLLSIAIGLPSRALWLLRTKRDPLAVLRKQAEKALERRSATATGRSDRPRVIACGASGVAYHI
jgi:hypothetical protein